MRVLLAVVLILASGAAGASSCLQVAERARVVPASLEADEVSISYVGHAAFRIESAGGVTAVTDFSGWWGDGPPPDVATMNRAHITHWTPDPDPAIERVLPGWGQDGEPAKHWLMLDDMLVRNVPTDIRRWDGGTEPFGNSIFIFEAGDLCVGHLGHLHHQPTEAQYGLIGRLDVVMAPVDGGYTMNQPAMIEVLKRLRARVVIPMHWFGETNLRRFLDGMRDEFDVVETDDASVVLSRERLPARPRVLVLRP
jgi:L-ascorbate metabolism protein UlaG (beta-lactamase superfamily)